eukprot:CAMPEP_0173188458 /NCGR_PEP_ID=MMETSP1141-20130122/11267_1 /TAXON_ID=483371 /ORGANISM="non described non described, Strain CCMP2298" /LENGTH=80 /DNA_ID=CAMNT_0014112391 /DNA_START=388 /DNA_END=630 /DNA_ORIENTATION=-
MGAGAGGIKRRNGHWGGFLVKPVLKLAPLPLPRHVQYPVRHYPERRHGEGQTQHCRRGVVDEAGYEAGWAHEQQGHRSGA